MGHQSVKIKGKNPCFWHDGTQKCPVSWKSRFLGVSSDVEKRVHNGHLLHLKLWHANWSFPCTRPKHWVYISLRIIYPRYVIQIPLQDYPPPFPHQHNLPLYEDMKSPSDPIPHNKHRNITPYFGAFSCFVIHANTYQSRKSTKKHGYWEGGEGEGDQHRGKW